MSNPDPSVFAPRVWRLAHGRVLELGPRGVVMGIINATPDSFSDGGEHESVDAALISARALIDGGATILDVGGESTRPGANPVSPQEEQCRVLPIIEAFGELNVALSVDTYRAETARLALAAGAHIVNDVWGFQRDDEIASVVADTGAGAVLMHTGRERNRDQDVLVDQRAFLKESLEIALGAGLEDDRIVLDPGFGFAKNVNENVELLARFEELHAFGLPLLVGTSRKRFLGAVAGIEGAARRDTITAASGVIARLAGAHIFRVHDARSQSEALAIADAVIDTRTSTGGPNQ